MVQFFFIRILIYQSQELQGIYRLSIRFTNTLGHDFGITFLMTSVFAILTLIARSIFEELATKGTSHDLVELLHYEFMPVDFSDLFLSLTNCALTT